MRNYKASSQRYGYGRYPRKVAFGTAQRMRNQGGGQDDGAGLAILLSFVPMILLAIFLASFSAH